MGASQREFVVNLPIGYIDDAGINHQQAVLRKMCGYDEEILYDESLNSGALVTELLKNCLIRLGDISSIDSDLVAQLYTADRNYLLLELRRITLGNELHSSYLCPHCGSNISVIEDLDEVEVHRINADNVLQDIQVKLDDGYMDREGKKHTDLTLTLPRGVDEEVIAPMLSKDPLKAQDALLLRCIKGFGNLPRASLEAFGVKILRELTMGDRRKLQSALSDDLPGINLQRLIHCGPCSNSFKGVMDVSNFFVSG